MNLGIIVPTAIFQGWEANKSYPVDEVYLNVLLTIFTIKSGQALSIFRGNSMFHKGFARLCPPSTSA